MTELLCKHDLSEIEYNKTLSENSSISIRIKKGVEQVLPFDPNNLKVANNFLNSNPVENSHEKVEEVTENSSILSSPMVGTVYLSPDPNSDPFVKIGDTVKEGQPVVIIEAMKTMNHIPANKSGIIRKIFVDDASPVEFGDPLITIE
ncbi:MAG: acetyl-CoA carboxylase, biotin carboxyl carrier protein [Rhodobacteraceae bacterium]|nr:MAG: acetyl-CoA carboxylase, biotin carboxyl carrier protein [Paracoccaceae bacterium]